MPNHKVLTKLPFSFLPDSSDKWFLQWSFPFQPQHHPLSHTHTHTHTHTRHIHTHISAHKVTRYCFTYQLGSQLWCHPWGCFYAAGRHRWQTPAAGRTACHCQSPQKAAGGWSTRQEAPHWTKNCVQINILVSVYRETHTPRFNHRVWMRPANFN